jgi:cell division protein FtsX
MAPLKAEVLLLKTDASTASAAATLREALASTRGQPRVALMSKAKTVDALITWLDKVRQGDATLLPLRRR